jgi:hypothetical protein
MAMKGSSVLTDFFPDRPTIHYLNFRDLFDRYDLLQDHTSQPLS